MGRQFVSEISEKSVDKLKPATISGLVQKKQFLIDVLAYFTSEVHHIQEKIKKKLPVRCYIREMIY